MISNPQSNSTKTLTKAHTEEIVLRPKKQAVCIIKDVKNENIAFHEKKSKTIGEKYDGKEKLEKFMKNNEIRNGKIRNEQRNKREKKSLTQKSKNSRSW
jgi:hypothetical protein